MKPSYWLDEVKKAEGNCSDYRLAEVLGISKQLLSKYRNGKTKALDETVAHRVEQKLKLTEGQVVFDQLEERAEAPEMKAMWHRMGKALTGAGRGVVAGAVATICLTGIVAFSAHNQAHAGIDKQSSYTLSAIRRWLRRTVSSSWTRLQIPAVWSGNQWTTTTLSF